MPYLAIKQEILDLIYEMRHNTVGYLYGNGENDDDNDVSKVVHTLINEWLNYSIMDKKLPIPENYITPPPPPPQLQEGITNIKLMDMIKLKCHPLNTQDMQDILNTCGIKSTECIREISLYFENIKKYLEEKFRTKEFDISNVSTYRYIVDKTILNKCVYWNIFMKWYKFLSIGRDKNNEFIINNLRFRINHFCNVTKNVTKNRLINMFFDIRNNPLTLETFTPNDNLVIMLLDSIDKYPDWVQP